MLDLVHLHPMVVHFPIALLIVGFLFELIYLITRNEFYSKAGFYLLVLGALGTFAAFLSGNLAEERIMETEALERVLETHEEAGKVTLFLVIFTFIFRSVLLFLKQYKGILQWIALALFALSILSVVRTAYYGGELVYNYGAGVQIQAISGNNTQDGQQQFWNKEGEEEDDD